MIKEKDIEAIIEQIAQGNQNIYTQSKNNTVKSLSSHLNESLSIQKKALVKFESTQVSSRKMLANISHDLKTPLSVISGLLELIDLETRDAQTNQVYLEKIEEKVTSLSEMMRDFFELSKLESDDTILENSTIDLVEFARKVLLNHYNQIEAAAMVLDLDLPESRVMMETNPMAMERILDNLINNAIAYGFEGQVLGLRIQVKDKAIELSVWDRGVGIEEKYYDQVFERLFTLEDSRNKKYSGSGLGLSITKRLVASLGGSIHLQSVPYHYTEFKLVFKS